MATYRKRAYQDEPAGRHREEAAAIDAEGLAIAAEHKAEAMTQAEKFEAAARGLGCDPDQDRFKDVPAEAGKA